MISPKDWKRILKNRLFGGCDPERLRAICEAGGCEVREFAAGEVVLSPETDRRAACLLLSGRAIVTTPDPGRNTLLRYLSENEPFGIANLFGDRRFVSLIRAESRCRIFFLTEAAAQRLLEEDHAFLYA